VDTQQALRAYQALGLMLHPLKPGEKTPLLRGWVETASNNLEEILSWDAKYPTANWGVVTGPESGITVVDIDPRNGGDQSWAVLVAKYGEPNAPKVSTPSGGMHYYFKHFMGTQPLGDGIDVLNNRHNAVLPPSRTASGEYAWAGGSIPKNIPSAPKWLRTLAKKESGARNDGAYKAACALFRSGMNKAGVLERVLAEYGDEDDQEHNAGLKKAVDSAEAHSGSTRDAFVRTGQGNAEDFDEYLPSDHGNALLFRKYAPSDLLYIQDVGWAMYTGAVWEIDDNVAARAFTAIMERMRDVYTLAASASVDMETRRFFTERLNHYTLSTNNKNVKNGMESAARLEGVAAKVEMFDSESSAHLLNFRNGTVDLRTGELRPHCKSDYITKIIDYDYQEDAPSSFWDATLDKIFGGDQELIAYVQTMLGASMIGSQDTRTLFIAYGRTGKNGKSTLFETLAEILGSYSDHAELKTLAGTDTGNLTELTTRMRIRGARLVVSSEVASTDSMDAAMIKRLTGGDTISARSMFKSTITFRPVCSIWLRTNTLPMVRGADRAFWERICIIPFEHRFEGEGQLEFTEVNRRFKAEAAGILSWLVQGAKIWSNRSGPIPVPEKVQALRDMYMTDTDTFADFLSERMTFQFGAESRLAAVHSEYTDFCKKRGMPAPPLSAFKQDLRAQSLLSPDGRKVLNYVVNADFTL
jgi:putative DNA primase/helicase